MWCGDATSTRWSRDHAVARRAPSCAKGAKPSHRCSTVGSFEARSSTTRRRRDVEELRARYVVIADGANSRFGRALGTTRNRSFPQGMAIRGYYESPLHAEPWIESALDVRDRNGNSLPGLRMDLPGRRRDDQRRHRPAVDVPRLEVGQHLAPDGRVRRDRAGVLGHRAGTRDRSADGRPAADGWIGRRRSSGRRGSSSATRPATINPFNGEGIDYAYETGRMAAGLLDEALRTGDGLALPQYPRLLDAEYGLYFKVARAVRQGHRQPGAAEPAHARRHAVTHAHGVGAAHHGQPAAGRRARPRRSRLPSRRRHRPHRPRARRRLTLDATPGQKRCYGTASEPTFGGVRAATAVGGGLADPGEDPDAGRDEQRRTSTARP